MAALLPISSQPSTRDEILSVLSNTCEKKLSLFPAYKNFLANQKDDKETNLSRKVVILNIITTTEDEQLAAITQLALFFLFEDREDLRFNKIFLPLFIFAVESEKQNLLKTIYFVIKEEKKKEENNKLLILTYFIAYFHVFMFSYLIENKLTKQTSHFNWKTHIQNYIKWCNDLGIKTFTEAAYENYQEIMRLMETTFEINNFILYYSNLYENAIKIIPSYHETLQKGYSQVKQELNKLLDQLNPALKKIFP